MRLPSFSLFGLQSRILASFVLLVVVVEAAGFLLTAIGSTASARKSVSADVVAGARIFERLLELDSQRLVEGTRMLAANPAFRDSVAAADRGALGPALAKHSKRIGAVAMLLIDADRRVIAGTLDAELGRRFPYVRLLDRAAATQQATALVPVGGQLYQLVVVPLQMPEALAWVVAGIRIDDALAQELRNVTRLDVSFLTRPDDGEWQNRASTLQGPARTQLARDIAANRYSGTDSDGNAEFGDDAITRVVNLAPRADEGAVAVLQGQLSAALDPLRAMQLRLALISLLGVIAAIIGGLALARTIVKPVRELTAAAQRVAAGDYSALAAASGNDEIGKLRSAFRAMQEGVAARLSGLTDLAHRDVLTGLPTRVLFADRLGQAVGAGARAGSPVAVLVLNLDHFGHVNDTLGHPIGDLLLREVAARLRSGMRRATDTVARISGDEFAILMAGSRLSEAQRAAEAILRALQVKMTLDGHVVDVHASIGIAACPDHGHEPTKLLERAEVAMRVAKRDRLRIAVWEDQYDEHGEKRLALMSDLKKAVDNDELTLIYQPWVVLREGSEHYVEALVRWQHPTRGLVPPSEFLPLAEQTGYIRTITQWVLGRAIAQCAEWRGRGLAMNVSINISACDLIDSELPVRLAELLERLGCSAEWVSLEINESAIVGEPGHALKNLERLHALGVKLVIDDFGTGYASLAYLRRLPLDELKIDRSFILGMATDAGDALIVRSTIELAHELSLTVVACGIEDEATFEQLRELGCDGAQGFLLSRPLIADDVPSWIRESVWARPVRDRTSLRRVS